jgi:tRNA-2-methylthio-N6-dimethylallyladenosine synthase
MLGGHSKVEPPLPIPNRTVKRLCADDSVDYPCESRSLPSSLCTTQSPPREGFGVCGALLTSRMSLPPESFQVPKKIFIKTFGCQMNEYDSSKMLDVMRVGHGTVPVSSAEEADILLLNTCSIREKSEDKVFHQLGRWRELKQSNPDLLIAVGGCVASQEGQAIIARAPYVDVVFGPQTLHRLPQLIQERKSSGRPQVDISFPEIEKFDHLPDARVEGYSAYLSIMEGCSKYCTYCIVPFTRGAEVSRPFDDVLLEATRLAESGVKELTLLGQNVNGYRGEMHDGEMADLALLLHYLAEVPGIELLRFTTSHPIEFSQSLIDAYASIPKLANCLHLPVQSGSDRVLAAMKRGYTALEFKSKIRQLRSIRPDISITSDFIVGFPGETVNDFEATLKLIDEIGFDASFSFIYSPRPGTPASDMPDEESHDVKQARLLQLQTRIEAHTRLISQNMVGSTQKVLIKGVSKKNAEELSGWTENNRMVNFAGSPRLIGQFINVAITEASGRTLRGTVITQES